MQCDKCHKLEVELVARAAAAGAPLAPPMHPTHVPATHTLCMDVPPREWRDLDNHPHVRVWGQRGHCGWLQGLEGGAAERATPTP